MRFDKSASAALIAALMSGFVTFSEAIFRAVFSEYPARIAAWVPLRSTRYSSTKRRCFGVNGLADDVAGLVMAQGVRASPKKVSIDAKKLAPCLN